VFQSRYKAMLCQPDPYLGRLVRYIHLNPVRAGLVRHAEAYRWSRQGVYLGPRREPWVESSRCGAIVKGPSSEPSPRRLRSLALAKGKGSATSSIVFKKMFLPPRHEGTKVNPKKNLVSWCLCGGDLFLKVYIRRWRGDGWVNRSL